MIPLLAESEKGRGQTESCGGNTTGDVVSTQPTAQSQTSLERETLEGDSPVDECAMAGARKSRASWIGGLNMAGLTANPK